MKRILLALIAVFLFVGSTVSAQEDGFTRVVGNIGAMMNFTKAEDIDWSNNLSLSLGARIFPKYKNDNLNFGLSIFWDFNLINEMEWKSSDGTTYRITKDKTQNFLAFDIRVGASLQGPISGIVNFVLDGGFLLNHFGASYDYGWGGLLYGDISLSYRIFDLGLYLNGGVQVNLNKIVLEAGVDIGFSFFRKDSYAYYSKLQEKDISGYGDEGNFYGNFIFRPSPYILLGYMF